MLRYPHPKPQPPPRPHRWSQELILPVETTPGVGGSCGCTWCHLSSRGAPAAVMPCSCAPLPHKNQLCPRDKSGPGAVSGLDEGLTWPLQTSRSPSGRAHPPPAGPPRSSQEHRLAGWLLTVPPDMSVLPSAREEARIRSMRGSMLARPRLCTATRLSRHVRSSLLCHQIMPGKVHTVCVLYLTQALNS